MNKRPPVCIEEYGNVFKNYTHKPKHSFLLLGHQLCMHACNRILYIEIYMHVYVWMRICTRPCIGMLYYWVKKKKEKLLIRCMLYRLSCLFADQLPIFASEFFRMLGYVMFSILRIFFSSLSFTINEWKQIKSLKINRYAPYIKQKNNNVLL